MPITNFPQGVSSYGIPVAGSSIPTTFGNIYFVDYDNGNDSNVGTSMALAFKTVAAAYAACTTNNHDVICMDANSTNALSSMLTVAKNRVHFVGLDGGGHLEDQRTKIALGVTTAATDVATMLVTGTGCTFRNIKFINSNTLTQSVAVVQDAGSDNVYMNCSFEAGGSAQLTATGGCALLLQGDSSRFVQCRIGEDTLPNTVANQVVLIQKSATAQCKRNVFQNCLFRTYASAGNTTHVFVRLIADGDLDRDVIFDDCTFSNFYTGSDGALMAVAIATLTGFTSGVIRVKDCSFFPGITKVSAAASGANTGVSIVGTVPTAGTSSIAVVPV